MSCSAEDKLSIVFVARMFQKLGLPSITSVRDLAVLRTTITDLPHVFRGGFHLRKLDRPYL